MADAARNLPEPQAWFDLDEPAAYCEHCDAPLDESTDGVFLDASNCHVCEGCWNELDPPGED